MSKKPRATVWPVYLLCLPAFVAVWSGWVGLGGLAGFGVIHPLPGIWDSAQINSAITLPIGVETYAAYALYVWLSKTTNPAAERFAKWSAIGSLVLGGFGQVAYHVMVAAGIQRAWTPVVVIVSCIPVAVLGMGSALAHMIRNGSGEPEDLPPVRIVEDPPGTLPSWYVPIVEDPEPRLPEAPVSPAPWTEEIPAELTDVSPEDYVRDLIERGEKVTGQIVGDRFRKTDRWGRGVISAVTK